MKYSRVTLLLLVAATALYAAGAVTPDYYPPGTRVIVGLSLRDLTNSSLLKSLGAEAQTLTAGMMKDSGLTGLNPLTDIDDLVFASTGAGEKPPSLVIMHGRFNLKTLEPAGTLYHGVLMVADKSKADNGTMAFLDASTALAGDPAEVRAAIDRLGHPASISTHLKERAEYLSGRFALWGVGNVPEGFKSATASENNLDSVDRFEFGASLKSGLELNGEVHLRTPEAAAKMQQTLMFVEMMMKGQKTSPDGAKFSLTSANGTIKLSLAIPEEELRKGIEAQKAGFAAALNSRLQPARPPEPSGPPPSRPPTRPATIVNNDRGDTVKVTLPGGH